MEARVIDAHAHCGIIERYPPQSYEDYLAAAKSTPIDGVAMFSPVSEIYDRRDPDFRDTPAWREQRRASNQYLLSLTNREIEVFPYLFIWNDFAVDQLDPRHYGIKWHRHDDEPVYHYDDPACPAALSEIRRRGLPIVFEEELAATIRFINELAVGIHVIIPHLGYLNGGYRAIARAGLWENPMVYTDTSLAAPETVMSYIRTYGHERIFFGSDFPFGSPAEELEKLCRLPLPESVRSALTGGSIQALWQKAHTGADG